DADILAITGASLALNLSRIPFWNPVAAVRIGRIQGQWVLNPTFQQLDYSDVDIVVAGTESAILMVEGGSLEVPEEAIAEGLIVAHAGMRELIEIQQEVIAELEVPAEMEWSARDVEAGFRQRVMDAAATQIRDALRLPEKQQRNE